MEVGQRLEELGQEAGREEGREAEARVEGVHERSAREVAEHEVVVTGAVAAALGLTDPRVAEAQEEARAALEAVRAEGVAAADELDDHVAARALV